MQFNKRRFNVHGDENGIWASGETIARDEKAFDTKDGAVGLIDGGAVVDVAVADRGVQYQNIGRDRNKYNDGSRVRRHCDGCGRGSYLTCWGSKSSASNLGERKGRR